MASVFSRVLKEVQGNSNIVHIDSETNFKAYVLGSNRICFVDSYSNRCPPCRVLAPTMSSRAGKYAGRATVCKVDIDQLNTVVEQYAVTAIPTVLIIKNGKETSRLVGLRTEAEYVTLIDELVRKAKHLCRENLLVFLFSIV